MHPIEVTVKGLSRKPKTYNLSAKDAKEVAAFIASKSNEKSIPASELFPDLDDPAKSAANALRGLRYREDLTQKELADKVGIRQHHLSEMENAKRPIGKEMAKKLASALNADWRMLV